MSTTMSTMTPMMTWAGPLQTAWLMLKVSCHVMPKACVFLRLNAIACGYLCPQRSNATGWLMLKVSCHVMPKACVFLCLNAIACGYPCPQRSDATGSHDHVALCEKGQSRICPKMLASVLVMNSQQHLLSAANLLQILSCWP